MVKSYELGYVASPLNAPTKKQIFRNMRKARSYERALNLNGGRNRAVQGYLPKIYDDNILSERRVALKIGTELLKECDALILCGKKITNGMYAELKTANASGIAVYRLKGTPTGIKIADLLLWKLKILRLCECSKNEVKTLIGNGVKT